MEHFATRDIIRFKFSKFATHTISDTDDSEDRFYPDVIRFEPDEDEMGESGATVPLFWHTDRHCRTRSDPSFKVKITSSTAPPTDISCIANLTAASSFDPVGIDLETFQNEKWSVNVSLSNRIVGMSDKSWFTLVMVDPDAPSGTAATARYWLHWMVIDVNLEALLTGVSAATCTVGNGLKCLNVLPMTPPTPPKGSGLHRYQFLLFLQNELLIPYKEEFATYSKRSGFDPAQFENEFNLDFLASALFTTSKQ